MIHSIEKTERNGVSLTHQASKNILLVEDNEIAALQVRMVLEKEGFNVESVTGGRRSSLIP